MHLRLFELGADLPRLPWTARLVLALLRLRDRQRRPAADFPQRLHHPSLRLPSRYRPPGGGLWG